MTLRDILRSHRPMEFWYTYDFDLDKARKEFDC